MREVWLQSQGTHPSVECTRVAKSRARKHGLHPTVDGWAPSAPGEQDPPLQAAVCQGTTGLGGPWGDRAGSLPPPQPGRSGMLRSVSALRALIQELQKKNN